MKNASSLDHWMGRKRENFLHFSRNMKSFTQSEFTNISRILSWKLPQKFMKTSWKFPRIFQDVDHVGSGLHICLFGIFCTFLHHSWKRMHFLVVKIYVLLWYYMGIWKCVGGVKMTFGHFRYISTSQKWRIWILLLVVKF